MAEPLPKWLMRAYSSLWVTFKTREFGSGQASECLSKSDPATSLILSELRKARWLVAKLDENDARKRKYQLRAIATLVNEIAGGKIHE